MLLHPGRRLSVRAASERRVRAVGLGAPLAEGAFRRSQAVGAAPERGGQAAAETVGPVRGGVEGKTDLGSPEVSRLIGDPCW